MSERMTGILLPGRPNGVGWAEWGRKTPAEMIASYRRHAEQQKAEAEAILAAADEDFYVDTYLGPYARAKTEVLQAGRKR